MSPTTTVEKQNHHRLSLRLKFLITQDETTIIFTFSSIFLHWKLMRRKNKRKENFKVELVHRRLLIQMISKNSSAWNIRKKIDRKISSFLLWPILRCDEKKRKFVSLCRIIFFINHFDAAFLSSPIKQFSAQNIWIKLGCCDLRRGIKEFFGMSFTTDEWLRRTVKAKNTRK